MPMLLRIAERVLNRPLLVHPDKIPLILSVLQGRIPVEIDAAAIDPGCPSDPERAALLGGSPEASRFVGDWAVDRDEVTGESRVQPYRRTAEGVANIAVVGSLVNRGAWLGASSGLTSYEGLQHQVRSAAADPKVRAILLDIHSPGGEATGAFETAAVVREAAQAMPVIAVVNGMAASAAYAIASAATRIVTTPTGVAGSIGVVLLHADYSRALDKAGITPTLIFAGAHKVDGNPFAPLPDVVRADLQAEVERFHDLFIETVAAGRRGLSPAAVRATEARTFIGQDAVDRGLADEVGSFAAALSDLTRSARSTTIGGVRMSNTTPAPVAGSAQGAPAASPPTPAAPSAEQLKQEGAASASARIAGILDHADAKGREALARHLAFKTTLSVDEAGAALAAAPKAEAPRPDPLAALAAAAPAAVLGAPPATGTAAADHGWGKAVAAANRRFDTRAG